MFPKSSALFFMWIILMIPPSCPKLRVYTIVQSNSSYKGKTTWTHRHRKKILWDLSVSWIKTPYKCHLKETSGGLLYNFWLETSWLPTLGLLSCCIVYLGLEPLQGCQLHKLSGLLIRTTFTGKQQVSFI